MVACSFLRLRAPCMRGRSLLDLSRAASTQSQQRLTTQYQNVHQLFTGSAGCYTGASKLHIFTAIQSFSEARRRTVTHIGDWPVIGGFGSPFASMPLVGANIVQQLLNTRLGEFPLALDASVSPYCGCRRLHSIAANLQRRGEISAGELPQNGSAVSPTAADINVDLNGSSSASSPLDVLCTAEPSKGSYAQELLQHIHDVTELASSAKVAAGAGASSEWFVDWLLALKIGLDVPWYVALPAAGCLLRLVTLPIAIDSERDRRQRQLVDPQFSRMKEKMKVAYETGNTQEYQRLRAETKTFLKKHGIGVLPTSLFQMLLLGLALSFSTPAIRRMAGDADSWRDFAFEQPGWLESLALPDSSGLTALLCWLVLVSTMAAGWIVSSKIQKQNPSTSVTTGILSPLVMRGVSLGAATLFAFYSGTQLPAAALLFLVPAVGLQSVFLRIFRLRCVERGMHFVPEGLRPLQQTYVALLERREPTLVAAWRAAEAHSRDKVAEATAKGAAETSRAIVLLWREILQKDKTAATLNLKTWAKQVSEKRRERLSLSVSR